MADIGNWRPVKGTHAIQMASLSIAFAEPVNDRPWKRIEDVLSKAAYANGLKDKHPIRSIEMRIGGPTPTASVNEPNNAGVEFVRRTSPDATNEKLQAMRASMNFENWDYTRWAPMKRKASGLMKGAYELYVDNVEVVGVTATYVDVFIAKSPGIEPDAGLIVNSASESVNALAFNRDKPWHTHSGWFEYPEKWCRRLKQVNVDVVDADFPDGDTRIIQIITTINDQFGQKGLEILPSEESTWARIILRLQNCHSSLKCMLESVLTKEAAAAISLGPTS